MKYSLMRILQLMNKVPWPPNDGGAIASVDPVKIYNASSLPVPKPSAPWLDITSPNRGWDPTDPDPANPWRQ